MIRALLNAMKAWCAGAQPMWPVLMAAPASLWPLQRGRTSGVRATKRAALHVRNRRRHKRRRGHAH